jgi:hypothetical protein
VVVDLDHPPPALAWVRDGEEALEDAPPSLAKDTPPSLVKDAPPADAKEALEEEEEDGVVPKEDEEGSGGR